MHQNRCYDTDVDHCESDECEIKRRRDEKVLFVLHRLIHIALRGFSHLRAGLDPVCPEYATQNR